jgi:glycogen operon protein
MDNPAQNPRATMSAHPAGSALDGQKPTWISGEGTPSPLGVTWIEKEPAFNFAVFSEHAESVTLMLFSPSDLVHPSFTYLFDFLRNKSGPVWHCRIPAATIGSARYYAYSVAGPNPPGMFDPQKVLLDPYARCRIKCGESAAGRHCGNTACGGTWRIGRRRAAPRIRCDHL